MQRRTFLQWTIGGLGALASAVLGFPALAFLADCRNRSPRQSGMRGVAKLSDLEVNVPREFVIRETRHDAWNLHPDDVIGRVWLVRRPNDDVDAFTAVCPHLGCSVDFAANGFLCPCHGAQFDLAGTRLAPQEGANPAPRNMDKLPLEKIALAGHPGEFEIKVAYKRFKTSLASQEEDQ
jgi:menaquinol-cytochrome c reductase iron-sulfur subunit